MSNSFPSRCADREKRCKTVDESNSPPIFGRLLPILLAAALTACATENTQLNSERIEEMFGNYHIDVLDSDALVRRSNLYSMSDGIATCRTYAVVQFIAADEARIQNEHRIIADGGSLGATFKAAGWDVIKTSLHIGTLEITDVNTAVLQLMKTQTPQKLAFHVYQLSVAKGGEEIDYAVLAELHHPDYLGEHDLRDIYEIDSDTPLDDNYVNDIAALILR